MFLAAPVIRVVARMLMPSTRQETIWPLRSVQWRVGQLMASVTRSELTTVPRLVINGIVIAAMLGAVTSLYKAMQAAFSGDESSDGTWTLA